MQFGVLLCPICAGLCGPQESASQPSVWAVPGLREGVQRESPPCNRGGTLTAAQAWGCGITVTIITIYMLKSCLPQQSNKYLKILYITGSILFLIYTVNYLY